MPLSTDKNRGISPQTFGLPNLSFIYTAYGLIISSDLECPELLPAPETASVDITINLGKVPELDRHATRMGENIHVGSNYFQITIDNIAHYHAANGKSITVEPAEGANEGDVRLLLLGTVIAAVLHQRHLLPLHVSAVAVDGRAHAFTGESGAGKSTLAAVLNRHGLPLLCDDVGVVVPDSSGTVLFYPGFPRIKLWQDALEHFGIESYSLVRDLTRANKYHLHLDDTFHRQPLPLAALYQLERNEHGESMRMEPLDLLSTTGLLISHTYRGALVRQLGDPAAHIGQCTQIAKSIRAYRYIRPWNLAQLDGPSTQGLLRHLHS